MAAPRSGISKDGAFHILQNPRRRAVLRYLLEHDEIGVFQMEEITREVAAWEHDTIIHGLTSDERQRVHIALYQTHLPTLDEYGVIEYDQSQGLVEPTDLIYALEPFLDEGLHDADDHVTIPEELTESDKSGLTKTVTGLFQK